MKFCLLIDFDLQIRVTSSNTKPVIVWSRCGRHLENDVITPQRVTRFGRNLVVWCRIVTTGRRIPVCWTFVFSNRK